MIEDADDPTLRPAVSHLAQLALSIAIAAGATQGCAQDTARATPAGPAIAHTPWAPMGSFYAGDRVRYRAAGNLWYEGTVKQVGPDPQSPATTGGMYLVDGQGWYDHHFVAGLQREPWWTGFFVGDWEVSVPVAMNTKVVDGDLYRVVSGGMPLPPLRVSPDGSYKWRVLEGGGERLIEGRWKARDDAPGIVLLAGDQGADWTLYNVTDRSARETFGRAQIYLSSDCCTAQTAQRIPATHPARIAAGDRVLERRENGSFRLGTVVEVDGDRVKLRIPHLGEEWVERGKLRKAEF